MVPMHTDGGRRGCTQMVQNNPKFGTYVVGAAAAFDVIGHSQE